MSRPTQKHAEAEWAEDQRVFTAFVKATGLTIVADSVSKQEPPEPDIRCVVEGVGPRAYELSQVVHPNLTRALAHQTRVNEALMKAWRELPASARERTSRMHVLVTFHRGIRTGTCERVCPRILETLSTVESAFTGRIALPSDLKKLVSSAIVLGVIDLPLASPRLTASGYTNFGDPLQSVLEAKCAPGKYRTNTRAELLLWYELQPIERVEQSLWPNDIDARIRTQLTMSAFEAVTLLDVRRGLIVKRVER